MTQPRKKWRSGDLALVYYTKMPSMVTVIRIVKVAEKSVSFVLASDSGSITRLFDSHRVFNEHLYPLEDAARLVAEIAAGAA
jgi:hypothetical protein